MTTWKCNQLGPDLIKGRSDSMKAQSVDKQAVEPLSS
jgi:hypothetical protein